MVGFKSDKPTLFVGEVNGPDGKVGIGTTNPTGVLQVATPGSDSAFVVKNSKIGIGTLAPSKSLDVNGNARIRSVGSGGPATPIGVLNSDGTIVTMPSDVRLKKNIQTIDNGLDKVLQMRGVTFNWKEDDADPMAGMIAQEVLEIMPELVFQNSVDGYYGIHYGETVGLLIEAIKEQQQIINQQDDENSILKTKVEKLEEEITQIKTLLSDMDIFKTE